MKVIIKNDADKVEIKICSSEKRGIKRYNYVLIHYETSINLYNSRRMCEEYVKVHKDGQVVRERNILGHSMIVKMQPIMIQFGTHASYK